MGANPSNGKEIMLVVIGVYFIQDIVKHQVSITIQMT